MELLIMAAGMGLRFGGLKQIEPMGPNGEFIIDYSVFDAIKNGFNKIIFIIKEENYELFKKTIGKRIESHIPVEYVFQKLNNIPDFVKIPKTREKPWGTAHAIYSAKDKIKEPFVVINADDFYGKDAFKKAKEFLESCSDSYATICYEACKTLTENGTVKRGILEIGKNNDLISITESSIYLDEDKIHCAPLNGSPDFKISPKSLVSMNMLVFNPSIFKFLEEKMNDFFKENINNLEKCEFLIPDVLNQAKDEEYAKVKVVYTDANWYGVTYKEDTPYVKEAIKNLVDSGEYPNNLWN